MSRHADHAQELIIANLLFGTPALAPRQLGTLNFFRTFSHPLGWIIFTAAAHLGIYYSYAGNGIGLWSVCENSDMDSVAKA